MAQHAQLLAGDGEDDEKRGALASAQARFAQAHVITARLLAERPMTRGASSTTPRAPTTWASSPGRRATATARGAASRPTTTWRGGSS
jgi:hypothetical protein